MTRALGIVAPFLFLAAMANSETFSLRNGDTISGEVVRRDADRTVLDPPALGRIELPLDALAPDEEASRGLLGTTFMEGWERSAELGFSGKNGSSESQDVHAGFELSFEDEQRRWLLDADYFFSSGNSETSKQNARMIVNRDWLRPDSPWFFFANGRWDWDEFQAWDHRLSALGGIGRSLTKTESFELRSRLGAGITREFGSPDDGFRPEGLIGLEASWQVTEGQTLNVGTTFFPDLSDLGEFRNLTTADWKVKLTEEGLSLKIGIENEYETDVAGDSE
ncbi:MAG: DUF481 domain-containing protein, partial [Deltaproteobacteria bacterium]|nr:DUF481 domain-containing protein [Deltaproteobacteria bacterium]